LRDTNEDKLKELLVDFRIRLNSGNTQALCRRHGRVEYVRLSLLKNPQDSA
jgi:hypothetical protein